MEKKHPQYVGIDYSITSPAICVSEDGSFDKSVFHFFGKTKKHKAISQKNLRVYEYPVWKTDAERYEKLSEWTLEIIPENSLVYIEGYAFNARGLVFNLAENMGVLKYKLYKKGFTPKIIPPTVVKKIATGRGNASKDFVVYTFLKEFGENVFENIGKAKNPLTDIVDSYYVCLSGIKIMLEENNGNRC